jgi:hypothetical protein
MPIYGQNTGLAKDKKLRELILYISEKCIGDDSFGATKLNKLLFFADFLAYLNFGSSITRQEYFKLPNGPAPRKMMPIRRQMVDDGDIFIKQAEFYGFPQDRVIPIKKADTNVLFQAAEIALVDKVIAAHKGKTASEISDESHEFVGWKLAADKETIPYSVARLSRRPLSVNEMRHAKTLFKQAAELLVKEAA